MVPHPKTMHLITCGMIWVANGQFGLRLGQNEAKLAEQYPNRFQIKAVIETRTDFDATLNAYNEVLSMTDNMDFPWCLTPCYNLEEKFPLERFTNVIDWNEKEGGLFRVIGQQHKWLFGPDKKDV